MQTADELVLTLTRTVAIASLFLCGAMFAGYLLFDSQLALAQSADSLVDAAAAVLLALAAHLMRSPADENHPAGHSSAAPLAALGIATLAGVLAVQIAQQSIEALLRGSPATVASTTLAALFVTKGLFKTAVFLWARRAPAQGPTPTLDALRVDARNDVLSALVSLTGWIGARYALPTLDAWLALPVAAWIAWSGIELGLDNLRLLMGEAPPPARRAQLRAIAGGLTGVLGVHHLRAHYQGTQLQVHLHVQVDPTISVAEAHAIGEAVRTRVEAEPDVGHCSVHIDTTEDEDPDAASSGRF